MKISNSKKQLAKIISENGGWREGGMFSAQDQDGEVFFYTAKPTRGGGWWLHDGGLCGVCIVRDEALPNWHQTILSRDEYFHLYPAHVCGKRWGRVYADPPPEFSTSDKSANAGADGWIEWKGGECPVGDDALVEIKTRDGEIQIDQAYCWNWSHERGSPVQDRQIIAYRLHNQDQVEPEFCESVMRSIPEPSVKPTIEQLVYDYRAKLAIAQRAQEESDSRRADSEAALDKLYQAGLEIGLDIAIASKEDEGEGEPEFVITDWRDLKVGDKVKARCHDGVMIGFVTEMEHDDYSGDRPFRFQPDYSSPRWCTSQEFEFIRRP